MFWSIVNSYPNSMTFLIVYMQLDEKANDLRPHKLGANKVSSYIYLYE